MCVNSYRGFESLPLRCKKAIFPTGRVAFLVFGRDENPNKRGRTAAYAAMIDLLVNPERGEKRQLRVNPSLSAEKKSLSKTLGPFLFPFVRIYNGEGFETDRGFDRQFTCRD